MNIHEVISSLDVSTYQQDGRKSLTDLYAAYTQLVDAGWTAELVAIQELQLENREPIQLPIFAFISRPELLISTLSFWVLSGVHGEEPAGPNALAEEVPTLIEFARQGIPFVMLPMLNPAGYIRDWRYENARRDSTIGQSVTDCEPLLHELPSRQALFPVAERSSTAQAVTQWIVNYQQHFIPQLVFDHHEDEFEENPQVEDPQQFNSYIYYYGQPRFITLAESVTGILLENGMPISVEGKTRFGEQIQRGVVAASPDGSVDEFFASPEYIEDSQRKTKTAAEAVIVVETTRKPDGTIELPQRVAAHRQIIQNYQKFWQQVDQDKR